MIRRIIQIDPEKCNGCGACVRACHEGAIAMENGKARLMREDYCDGLGDCLPACPANAITFIERKAAPYDAAAVSAARTAQNAQGAPHGMRTGRIMPGQLQNWPVQLKLAPVCAPCFDNADLLIAADCTAYAYGGFHTEFIAGKTVLIACPKLDGMDYSEKLAQIFTENRIRSITITRMTVPCCGGIDIMVRRAARNCGREIPLQTVIIAPDGSIAL